MFKRSCVAVGIGFLVCSVYALAASEFGRAVSDADASQLVGGCEILTGFEFVPDLLCPGGRPPCPTQPGFLFTLKGPLRGSPHWQPCDCMCGDSYIFSLAYCF